MPSFLQTLTSESDPARLLALTLDHFSAETGTLHILESDGLLHLRASAGSLPPPVMDAIRVIPVGKGIAGLAVSEQRPIDTCNLQTDSRSPAPPGARATGAKGTLCVPLLVGGRAVGALGIGTSQERAFTADEVALLLEAGRAIGRQLWNS